MTEMLRDRPDEGAFHGRTHRFALRVYFEDTDTAGVVYYANYLRFMERAPSDMLRAVRIDQRAAFATGEGVYFVAPAHIKYRRHPKSDDQPGVIHRGLEGRSRFCVFPPTLSHRGALMTEQTRIP